MKFDEDFYNEVIIKYNYNPMDFGPMDFWFNGISPQIMEEKWLCHSGIDKVKDFNETIVTTGIGLSGLPHMGTLSQILRIIYLQRQGFKVQMVLGDLDSYNARNQPFKVVEERVKQYKEFIYMLGFNDKTGILRDQFTQPDIARTAFLLSKYLTDQDFLETEEDLSELYIKEKIYNGINFPVKQAILLMVSDFIHLGLYNGYKDIIVMLGLEEHKYVLLARKVLERMKMNFNILGMYSRIISGLNGYPKMSKSILSSSIRVDMPGDEIRNKIINEKDNYSKPEESVVYQLMSSVSYYSAEELIELYECCNKKDGVWQDRKLDYADKLVKLCDIWKEATN